jgi:hypothetical protein
MDGIDDADLRARAETTLLGALASERLPKKRARKQRAQAVEELALIAGQSLAVRVALVDIVSRWPRRTQWLPLHWLASVVIGQLIVDRTLNGVLRRQAICGMLASWFLAQEPWANEVADHEGAMLADRIIADLDPPLMFVGREEPEVMMDGFRDVLRRHPEGADDFEALADGLGLGDRWEEITEAAELAEC